MDGVALVTGGASGIGAAIVEAFLDKGVRGVTVADIDPGALKSFSTQLRTRFPGAQLLEAVVDVTNEESVKEMLRRTVDRFGKLDYAVNSAGITNKSKVDEYSTEAWDRVMNVNQKGVFFCMREELAQMSKQDRAPCRSTDPRRAQRGSIVNICSINSFVGAKLNAAYVTSKHGIAGLTKTCAIDYAAQGIRCNGIAPGYIETALTTSPQNIDVLRKSTSAEKTPAGRPGTPEEIADVVVFLSGEGASYVNGSIWEVDGGFLTL